MKIFLFGKKFTGGKLVYSAVAIGVSAGGLDALTSIIPQLSFEFPLPIAIVQHRVAGSDDFLWKHLDQLSSLTVKEPCSGEPIESGNVYISPPGYHMLIEPDRRLGLSVDLPVNYSIPSIDVLFESASDTYEEELIGIVLTGANHDGSQGLKTIKENGGLTIIEDPKTASVPVMPMAAMDAVGAVDYILPLSEIPQLLEEVST